MINYTIRRLISAIPTMFIVAVMVFFLIRCVPGNPALTMLSDDATVEEIADMEIRMGLDQPVVVQFGKWLGNAVRGNFGDSIYYDQPAMDVVMSRLESTWMLVILAMCISMLIGVPLGILAATHRNGILDKLCMVLSMIGISMPGFWLALNLVILFAIKLPIFPAVGYAYISEGGLMQSLKYLLLPAIALGLQRSASLARVTRSSMLDVLNSDYIRTARSKGLGEKAVIGIHALKNAMNQIITQIGISIAHLLGGAIVMENVFNIPGLGRLAFDSIVRRDYPVIQAHILYVAFIYVIVNLVVDLLYKFFDPRIEYK
ncbi:peptide ABC transporter [Clostridium sp. chh4-2]|uniref:ABC transporter permease n=1 Tax=Clostridium sp. chh4-2 TaxID=2067550 RepID=UPI000CCFB29A|nr:ABC transporter permease [Clostridium sp. chh4-2]PNV59880.1 peptide ABC transporter [Clostridium sp. chh4-2]